MAPAIKENGFKYWLCALDYADEMICIDDNLSMTMPGMQKKFEIKGDAIEELEIFLRISLSRIINSKHAKH